MAPVIRTLSDFRSEENSPQVRTSAVEASERNNAGGKADETNETLSNLSFSCAVIPTLKGADQVKAMLLRIAREFQPIIARRNYNVVSITEMCCCGDGLDSETNSRRKRRIMGRNVLGYNMTTFSHGRRTSRIHIRFRHAADHERFYPYEDVAGTLAHELAHCEHSQHNKQFYKLMDEILDEHAALMASSMRHHGAPMAAFSGSGNRLGSANAGMGPGHRLGGAENDPQRRIMARGYKLGGDSTFSIYMTPAEAAVAAAEARRRQQQLRLRGDRCCRPCVIDISDDDEEEEQENEERKPAAKRQALVMENSENQGIICVDLTKDEDDVLERKPAAKEDTVAIVGDSKWNCQRCTFENRAMALACEMCTTQRDFRPS